MFGRKKKYAFGCPKCGSALAGGECTECTYFDPATSRVYSKRQLSKAGSEVELGVLVDRTGSGMAFSRGVTTSSKIILETVDREVRGTRVWVQTHGDEDYGERPKLIARPGLARKATAAIRKIKYDGGGDGPETHLSAIEEALGQFTSASMLSSKAMLVFINDETKPARSGLSAREIGCAVREMGILLYLIFEPTHEFKSFCNAADGMLLEITNEPSEELMQSIGKRIAGSVVHSVRAGSLKPLDASSIIPPIVE